MTIEFPYIIFPSTSNDIIKDVKALLLLNNMHKTFDHVKAVAEMNIKIAEQYGLDKKVCELCGFLHDISAVIKSKDMLSYVISNDWDIDESEKHYNFLLHQRMSKVIAEHYFGIIDERVLSAIECHSTLKANPSEYDMALFIADKLAWDQENQPPFYKVVNDALKNSLEFASLVYMDYIVTNKMILHPHKWFLSAVQYLRGVIDKGKVNEKTNS